MKDGARVVFVDGSGGGLPDGSVERFGDRIRDGKKGLRIELWMAKFSGQDVLDGIHGDILGKNPTHIVVMPGSNWGSERTGQLLGKLVGRGRVLVVFWPEASPPPVAVPDEAAVTPVAVAAGPDPPVLLLPASLLGQGVVEVAEALAKLLGI